MVSKTGSDASPWKVQKNAPTVSATEVPGPLRPLMSCALWRIHESIHRNDANQVFLLSDQKNITNVAEKLNITVKSPNELSKAFLKNQIPVNLESSGELEREFHVGPPKPRAPIKNTAVVGPLPQMAPPTSLPNGHLNGVIQDEKMFKNSETVLKNDPSKETQRARPTMMARSSSGLSSQRVSPHKVESAGARIPLRGDSSVTFSSASKSPWNRPPVENANLKTSPEETMQSSQPSVAAIVDNEVAASTGAHQEQPDRDSSSRTLTTQPPHGNVWARSFADALSGNQTRRLLNNQPLSDLSTPVRIATPVEQKVTQTASSETAPDIKANDEDDAKPKEAPEKVTSEMDSDEEIVVFQPKRLSAQRKPAHQTSRPVTPNVQIEPAKPMQSSRQPAPKLHSSPRPEAASSGSSSEKQAARPKSSDGPAPVIIDPDSFGRDFAVNTNSLPKNGKRSMRARHSPRPSVQNTVFTPSRPSSSHRQQRSSPKRASPKPSPKPRHITPMETTAQKDSQPAPQPPIGTPRSPMLSMQNLAPPVEVRAHTLNASTPPPVEQSRAPTLNVNAPIFQPAKTSPLQSSTTPHRPAHPSAAQLGPIGSGRPSSKASRHQSPALDAPPAPPVEAKQHGSLLVRDSKQVDTIAHTVPQDVSAPRNPAASRPEAMQRQAPESTAKAAPGPRFPQKQFVPPQAGSQSLSRNPNLGQRPPRAPAAPQGNGMNGPSRGYQLPPRGRGMQRPAKPTLFEPDLDHTRAFQPDTFEPRKNAVPDVQYVLKSGSTREQARGKGKLWVG